MFWLYISLETFLGYSIENKFLIPVSVLFFAHNFPTLQTGVTLYSVFTWFVTRQIIWLRSIVSEFDFLPRKS